MAQSHVLDKMINLMQVQTCAFHFLAISSKVFCYVGNEIFLQAKAKYLDFQHPKPQEIYRHLLSDIKIRVRLENTSMNPQIYFPFEKVVLFHLKKEKLK